MFKKSLLALSVVLASAAHAQVLDGVDAKTAEAIKSSFESKINTPASRIDYIGKSEFPGIYVILANGYSLPIYSDVKMNKMFVGNYIDNTRDKANIIEEIKEKNYRIPVSKFVKKNNTIIDKTGKGARVMYVFADANCTYCKKLEAEVLNKVDNVTVYTVPVSILRPGGEMDQKVKTLLCKPEAEQGKLWIGTMVRGEGEIGSQDCAKAAVLESNTEISRELGVSGTPTIVFPNGRVHVGFIAIPDLERKLTDNQK